jgi:hypothetical protein
MGQSEDNLNEIGSVKRLERPALCRKVVKDILEIFNVQYRKLEYILQSESLMIQDKMTLCTDTIRFWQAKFQSAISSAQQSGGIP